MSPHALVGTAGHVDHGKTSLVLALTGIDCDRWAEEKARGITIDLGFAHLADGDFELGFVDVPGHERFLHNALAGLGGIRVLLLVVAADEGVRPQTREHLAIATLLGVPRAVVALTKCDLVDTDLAELATLEVGELLAPTPFAGAPIVPVSSTTGVGLPALRSTLLAAARAEADVAAAVARPTRLPIDRAFHLRGLGVVVTGSLLSGTVRLGDALAVEPGGRSARVRSIQVHGASREVAEAGERTALQLAGVELEAVARGTVLLTPGAFAPRRRLLARIELLPEAPAPLRGQVPIRCHLYSRELLGRLRPIVPEEIPPGGSGIAELRLRSEVVSARGDRFVLRRPSPELTLGGGEVLDPSWRPRRRAERELSARACGGGESEALAAWIGEGGAAGATAAELGQRLGVSAESVAARLAAGVEKKTLVALPTTPPRWLLPRFFDEVGATARRELLAYFRDDRLARGMPRAELVRRLLPGRAAALADVWLGWLTERGVLVVAGDLVTLPGRKAELSPEETRLAEALRALLERAGLEPPAAADLVGTLGTRPSELDAVVRFLVARGEVVRLTSGALLGGAAFQRLRQDLLATGWERFSVAQFKERFGLSRKWAIPLLELLDSSGATRRVGDERLVRRGEAAAPADSPKRT